MSACLGLAVIETHTGPSSTTLGGSSRFGLAAFSAACMYRDGATTRGARVLADPGADAVLSTPRRGLGVGARFGVTRFGAASRSSLADIGRTSASTPGADTGSRGTDTGSRGADAGRRDADAASTGADASWRGTDAPARELPVSPPKDTSPRFRRGTLDGDARPRGMGDVARGSSTASSGSHSNPPARLEPTSGLLHVYAPGSYPSSSSSSSSSPPHLTIPSDPCTLHPVPGRRASSSLSGPRGPCRRQF